MQYFILLLILIFSALENSSAQFGSELFKSKLQTALLNGDSAICWSLITEAKIERGRNLGQANSEPELKKPDSSGIDEASLDKCWNNALDQIMAFDLSCPQTATETPASILGVFYAQFAQNQLIPKEHLKAIGLMLEAQQFNEKRAINKNGLQFGAFGLCKKDKEDDCHSLESVQRLATTICKKYPEACLTFIEGQFAGREFLVADQGNFFEKWDAPLAYHQAWAVEEMIHGHLILQDSIFYKSAMLASQWCMEEKPVINQQAAAKLVWALAAMYDLTGDISIRDKMTKLLNTSILPSILMDRNEDRIVDGTNFLYDSLVSYAQIPGRCWDAVNANSWNTANISTALINAYAALRDRGDTQIAYLLKPYLEATLNNISREINQFGTPPTGTGFRDLSFAIFDALWKIDRSENVMHQDWQKSARILWNSGALQTGGIYSVNLGQLIRLMSQKPYRARHKF